MDHSPAAPSLAARPPGNSPAPMRDPRRGRASEARFSPASGAPPAVRCASIPLPFALVEREWRNLADAPDLGSGARKGVGVQIPPLAPLPTLVGIQPRRAACDRRAKSPQCLRRRHGVSRRDVDDDDGAAPRVVLKADDPAPVRGPGPRWIRVAPRDQSQFRAVGVGHEPVRPGTADLAPGARR